MCKCVGIILLPDKVYVVVVFSSATESQGMASTVIDTYYVVLKAGMIDVIIILHNHACIMTA